MGNTYCHRYLPPRIALDMITKNDEYREILIELIKMADISLISLNRHVALGTHGNRKKKALF